MGSVLHVLVNIATVLVFIILCLVATIWLFAIIIDMIHAWKWKPYRDKLFADMSLIVRHLDFDFPIVGDVVRRLQRALNGTNIQSMSEFASIMRKDHGNRKQKYTLWAVKDTKIDRFIYADESGELVDDKEPAYTFFTSAIAEEFINSYKDGEEYDYDIDAFKPVMLVIEVVTPRENINDAIGG